jgi:hypothetical protein
MDLLHKCIVHRQIAVAAFVKYFHKIYLSAGLATTLRCSWFACSPLHHRSSAINSKDYVETNIGRQISSISRCVQQRDKGQFCFFRNTSVLKPLSSFQKSGTNLNDVGFEVLTAVVMKSTIFWDITLFSPLEVNLRFGRTPPSSGSKNKPSSTCHLLSRWFLARIIVRPWRRRRYVPPKRRLTPNGLHGIISQKIILFKLELA